MVWDELGGKMEEMLKKPNSIFNQVLYCLTALYSAAGRSYFPDGKAADTEDTPIIQPHCCLYGTGTNESVFKTFEPKLIENGFIGRVNFFFADPNKKLRKLHDQPPIPPSILESIKAWCEKPLALPTPHVQPPSLFQAIPEPIVVAYTNEAEQIFSRLTDQCENAQEKTPDTIKRLWVRTVQEAKKLALFTHAVHRWKIPLSTQQPRRGGADSPNTSPCENFISPTITWQRTNRNASKMTSSATSRNRTSNE